MSPTAKFNALLSSVTVSIMFYTVAYIGPLLADAGIDYPKLLSLAALVTSAGLYSLLALGLRWLMEKIEFIRRVVLGPTYMHGTWIGWFRGHTGEIRYMVEHYIQDLDSLVVTGRSYTAFKKEHGYWVSDAVALDAKKGQLMYTYSFNILTQTAPLVGIHTSLLQRKSASAAPTELAGFAHDLNDRFRSPVQSQKLDSDLVRWEEALDKAVTQFKDV